MCNPREEGVASDDASVSVFIHNDDDKANNQHVRVEEIYVSDDYFKQEANLPSEVQSDAHFRQVNKAGGGEKAVGGGKKVAGRGKKAEHNYVNVNGSLFVTPTLLEDDIEDGYVSEQLSSDYSDEEVFKKK